jgi:metal-sulfur cluster biosynthetic enzyme
MAPEPVSEELPAGAELTPLGVVMEDVTDPVNDGEYVTFTPTVAPCPANNVTDVDVFAVAVKAVTIETVNVAV